MSTSQSISAHDRAAANHARRFTLTVTKVSHGCMQTRDVPRLTRDEVNAEKAYQRECHGDMVSFDVEVA